mgnify:CR=1 FL=1
MKYNLTKSKVWQIIGIAVLCAVCVLTAVLGVVFGMNHSSEDLNVSKDMSEQDGLVISQEVSKGITLLSGVATTAADGTTTKTLTAVVNPTNAVPQLVVWSMRWKNDNSSWAKGKNIQDYISYSGDATITLECKAPFGEQIIVRATSSADDTKYGECTLDYAKRLESVSISLRNKTSGTSMNAINFNEQHIDYEIVPQYTYSVGTIDGAVEKITYNFTNDFSTLLSYSYGSGNDRERRLEVSTSEFDYSNSIYIGFADSSVLDTIMSLEEPITSFPGTGNGCNGYAWGWPESTIHDVYGESMKGFQYYYGYNCDNTSYDKDRVANLKKLQSYSGTVLTFNIYYKCKNGTTSKVSCTLNKGTCNFPSLNVSSVSVSGSSIIF